MVENPLVKIRWGILKAFDFEPTKGTNTSVFPLWFRPIICVRATRKLKIVFGDVSISKSTIKNIAKVGLIGKSSHKSA